jgi:hypothetical protein
MMFSSDVYRSRIMVLLEILLCAVLVTACAHVQTRSMETTAYCGCKQCCGWGRGSWKYLKLDFWNKYYVSGPDSGKPYHGHTASGSKPREPNPGLISTDTIVHPWMLPVRIVFPWLWIPHPGTIAADTMYYPFGTQMYVPGYGDGVVEDRGSAIKGDKRIDLYFNSHDRARQWGRQTVDVEIKE